LKSPTRTTAKEASPPSKSTDSPSEGESSASAKTGANTGFGSAWADRKKSREPDELYRPADVDFASVGNGTYVGSEDTGLVAADVRVTVEGGVVTAIDLLRHENGRGEKAEIVVDRVLAAQSLRVDAVSGATGSSKVILKAIERALKKTP
jgi:uncharacterized protein with FMN-binding domain